MLKDSDRWPFILIGSLYIAVIQSLQTGPRSTAARTALGYLVVDLIKSLRLIQVDQGLTHARFLAHALYDVARKLKIVVNSFI